MNKIAVIYFISNQPSESRQSLANPCHVGNLVFKFLPLHFYLFIGEKHRFNNEQYTVI